MPTSIASGTQNSVVGTEQTLVTDTTNKTYVLVVDTAAMVATAGTADEVELRIFTIALSGGTERLAYFAVFTGPQATPIKYSVPVPADISFRATLKQTVGATHAYPWKVLAL